MIGANKFQLNPETVCKALEEYLNKRATSDAQIEVTSVHQPGNSNSSFDVWTKAKEET